MHSEIVRMMTQAHTRHQKTPYDKLWRRYQKAIEADAETAYYLYGNWTAAWESTRAKWRNKILKEASKSNENSFDPSDSL